MTVLGKYVNHYDSNYTESVRYGVGLVNECVRAFEASRLGKKKIDCDHTSFFGTFGSEQLSLKVSIPNLLKVLQIQRQELPFTPFYPRIKYRWFVICQVQQPENSITLVSLPLAVLYYPEKRDELTSKEHAKQHLLPRITVALFANPPKPLVNELIDAASPSEKLFRKMMEAFESSRKHKKSELNYGHDGYGSATDLILIHGKATLVEIIKEEFAYKAPPGWWDLAVKKTWSLVYNIHYTSYFGKSDEEHVYKFARIHYPDHYSPTGLERAGKKRVLKFPNTPEYTIDSRDIATGKLVEQSTSSSPKEVSSEPEYKRILEKPVSSFVTPKSQPPQSDSSPKEISPAPEFKQILEKPVSSFATPKSQPPQSERKAVSFIDPVVSEPGPRVQPIHKPILKKRTSELVQAPVKRDEVKKPKATGARSRAARERRMKALQRAQRAAAPKNRYTIEPNEARVINYDTPGAFKYRSLEFPPLSQ